MQSDSIIKPKHISVDVEYCGDDAERQGIIAVAFQPDAKEQLEQRYGWKTSGFVKMDFRVPKSLEPSAKAQERWNRPFLCSCPFKVFTWCTSFEDFVDSWQNDFIEGLFWGTFWSVLGCGIVIPILLFLG